MLNKVEKGLSTMYWIRQGCIMLGSNLLFTGFFLWGCYAAFTAYRLETNGVPTEGVVIDMDESSGDGSPTYSPVVEYHINGQTYTFEGGISSNPPQYRVGERITIRYDKDDPSKAQIDKWSERWLMPVILIPAMCLTALLFNGIAFFSWRRGRDTFD
jgi:hypothetical protein